MTVASAGNAVTGTPLIGLPQFAQLAVRSEDEGRIDPVFFDSAETAKSAFNRLLGTVTAAAKGGGVTRVIGLGCRYLMAIMTRGGEELKTLIDRLTNAACTACGKTVELVWKPLESSSGLELQVVPCDCT